MIADFSNLDQPNIGVVFGSLFWLFVLWAGVRWFKSVVNAPRMTPREQRWYWGIREPCEHPSDEDVRTGDDARSG